MRRIIDFVIRLLQDILNVLKSFMAIFVYSCLRNKNENYKNRGKCNVLGNGPSLGENIEEILNSGIPSVAVNFFCRSEYFRIVRPEYYLFIDSSFFNKTDKRICQLMDDFCESMQTVDWEMAIFIPYHQRNSLGGKRLKSIKNNFLKIACLNTTPIDGPIKFRHKMYQLNLGMPIAYNVINAALVLAINIGFNEIHLFGAEHSFLKQMFFDNEGNLCGYNSHIYKSEVKATYMIPKGGLEDGLLSFAMCLKSYRYIKMYADSLNVKIFNRCKESYIDVFDKKYSY